MPFIYLVRHGEAEWTGENERYCGWSDVDLIDLGREQSERLARRFRNRTFGAIYSSDLRRAIATAKYLAETTGCQIDSRFALREQNYGEWDGKTHAELKSGPFEAGYRARNLAPADVAPPGGESYADILQRVLPLWTEILDRARHEDVLVVAHRGPNRVILADLLGAPLNAARRIHQESACVNIIDVDGDRVIVCVINDLCHLFDEE